MSALSRSLLAAGLAFSLGLSSRGAEASKAPQVQVVRAAGWSQGDTVREGAAEFMILLEIARLQKDSRQVGLVAVGDRRGLFPDGAEEALREAVLRGMPVVKLAGGGRVLPAPHGLFLDGGTLSEAEAAAVLSRCLAVHGKLPSAGAAAADAAAAAELREQLRLFQDELTLAASNRLAVR